MKKIYIVFTCDTHNTQESKEFAGAFTSQKLAIEAITEHAKQGTEETPELSDIDIEMLQNTGQTQGREENYIIQCEQLNAMTLFAPILDHFATFGQIFNPLNVR